MDAEQLAYMRQHNLSWNDLYDFPMSWDWWRHYSIYHTGVDPGPNEPPEETSIAELEERLEHLEELVTGLSPEDLRQYRLKQIYDEVAELKRSLHFTYKRIGDSIRTRSRPRTAGKRIKTTEV